MSQLTGTYNASLNSYDSIDAFTLHPSTGVFDYVCGGGQQIHIREKGKYKLNFTDESHFIIELFDVMGYDEDDEEFTISIEGTRSTKGEIKEGNYIIDIPYSGKSIYKKCIFFQDNPFIHFPTQEDSEFEVSPQKKYSESYYFDEIRDSDEKLKLLKNDSADETNNWNWGGGYPTFKRE